MNTLTPGKAFGGLALLCPLLGSGTAASIVDSKIVSLELLCSLKGVRMVVETLRKNPCVVPIRFLQRFVALPDACGLAWSGERADSGNQRHSLKVFVPHVELLTVGTAGASIEDHGHVEGMLRNLGSGSLVRGASWRLTRTVSK